MSGKIRKPGAAKNSVVESQKEKNTVKKEYKNSEKSSDKKKSGYVSDEKKEVYKPLKNNSGGKSIPGGARRIPGQKNTSKPEKEAKPEKKVFKRNKNLENKANRMKKKKYKVPLMILFLALSVGVVIFSAFLSYTYLVDRYENPVTVESIELDEETSVKFRIDKGMTTADIASDLYGMNLIENETIYRFLSKFNGFDGQYKVGTYTLCEGLSYDEVMTLLAGEPETVRVTFPEGFTTQQIADRLEANNVVTAEEFLKALETIDVSSYPFITNTSVTNRDHRLDGYLFPDTYEFDVKANVEDVIYKMLNRFNELFLPAYYEKAEAAGLTVDEVIVLASIVEREAKLQSERPVIAGVFINRLRSEDADLKKLQSCATIRYIYKKLYNIDVVNITEEHEKVEDPYNTYMHEGLTPGAISNPGIASIKAVLNYKETDYNYFVLNAKDGVGSHIFSVTYQEHLQAKKNYG